MPIKTTSTARIRTEVEKFANASLAATVSDYNTFETTKAADTTKTYSTRVVSSFYDGAQYVIIAEASYPETTDDPQGQVPELP